MDAGVCFDDVAHVADLEGEAGLFEGGLHLALAEEAEVAALDVGAAVGVVDGELVQGGVAPLDLVLVALQLLDGGLLGAGDGVLLPGGGLSRVPVLDEQVSDADLGWPVQRPAEVLLELRRVCTGGRVPLRLLGLLVEEVLLVVRPGEPYGPLVGEACVRVCLRRVSIRGGRGGEGVLCSTYHLLCAGCDALCYWSLLCRRAST